jgi:hypothetical protein
MPLDIQSLVANSVKRGKEDVPDYLARRERTFADFDDGSIDAMRRRKALSETGKEIFGALVKEMQPFIDAIETLKGRTMPALGALETYLDPREEHGQMTLHLAFMFNNASADATRISRIAVNESCFVSATIDGDISGSLYRETSDPGEKRLIRNDQIVTHVISQTAYWAARNGLVS